MPTITERQLALDASVWSPDSATFNPPNLSGTVSERTALEAMILHSDNTGTDMILKLVGPDNVRALIASAGLTNTLIPDSTRSFVGYLLGAPDYLTFTWDQYVAPRTTLRQTAAQHDVDAGLIGRRSRLVLLPGTPG